MCESHARDNISPSWTAGCALAQVQPARHEAENDRGKAALPPARGGVVTGRDILRNVVHTLYYPSRSNRFTLWHLTDLHIGHAACDEKQLRADVAAIAADPYAYWGGGGDYGDFIPRKGDKRYRETSIAPWLRGKNDICGRQVERFAEIVKPIADKCLYMAKGNHEDSVLSYYDRDVYLEMCRRVADISGREIRDIAIGWEGFVTLKFRRGIAENYGGTRKVVIYTHHGAGGGRKQGGHALRMEEVLLTYECDLALLGHRHIRQVVNKQSVAPSGKSITIRERLGVWCGSYLNTFIAEDDDGYPVDNYPQAKQLSPTTTGVVPVVIRPDEPSIMPVITNGIARDVVAALVPPDPPTAEPALHLVPREAKELAA